jgi:hypothetical protein
VQWGIRRNLNVIEIAPVTCTCKFSDTQMRPIDGSGTSEEYGVFDYPEDKDHFDGVLQNGGGVDANSHLFDFRDPDLKRKEFNAVRDAVFVELQRRYGTGCQLRCHEDCGGVGKVVDHLIPLSSNVLNKTLRGVRATADKKAPTQSFGANHVDNFALACRRCNAFKQSKIPTLELISSIAQLKEQKAA